MHSRRPIAVVLGTRPEAVKLASVIHALQEAGAPTLIISTGQHREMLDQMLQHFGIWPDVDLRLMSDEQTLAQLTAKTIAALDDLLDEHKPAAVVVQGDTTTAMCGALAAFYRRIPVAHVEAGLRTCNLANPFPEEGNRQLIGRLAAWHFAPTDRAAAALITENVNGSGIEVVGNTVIDAAHWTAKRLSALPDRPDGRRRLLVTLHRRETQGERQREISRMLRTLADRGDVVITFPVHLSPAVRRSVLPELAEHPAVELSEPLDYASFIAEIARSHLIVTDSGGVQEEAPSFGVPVVVCRDTTERQEGVDAGCAVLAGSEAASIRAHAETILDDDAVHRRMSEAASPFGDGTAGLQIARRLMDDLYGGDGTSVGIENAVAA